MRRIDGGAVTYDGFLAATDQYVGYNGYSLSEQQRILVYGLVEEAAELVADPSDPTEYGDLVFYTLRGAHTLGVEPSEVMSGAADLSSLQASGVRNHVPVRDESGREILLEDDPAKILGVAVLRVADLVDYPDVSGSPQLWYGQDIRPSLGRAFGDVTRAIVLMASKNGIDIAEAVAATLQKLGGRNRSSRVLSHAALAESDSTALRPDRARLLLAVPWIGELVTKAA